MIIYVNAAAPRDGNGSKEMPFKHINTAAQIAKPGDEVIVAPGVYREYVDPKNGGTEDARIVYRSEVLLGAVITGAEEVMSWKKYEGNVWVCRVNNGVFGAYNPYTTMVGGDTVIYANFQDYNPNEENVGSHIIRRCHIHHCE